MRRLNRQLRRPSSLGRRLEDIATPALGLPARTTLPRPAGDARGGRLGPLAGRPPPCWLAARDGAGPAAAVFPSRRARWRQVGGCDGSVVGRPASWDQVARVEPYLQYQVCVRQTEDKLSVILVAYVTDHQMLGSGIDVPQAALEYVAFKEGVGSAIAEG